MMTNKIVFVIALFFSCSAFAQKNNNYLIRFSEDTIHGLSGYKDVNGKVIFPARYKGDPIADTFRNIIAVWDKFDTSFTSYYLLKNGKKVGRDSVFQFDFEFDCESEEKIRFKDYKKRMVGFLDRNGNVIIPAIYNDASRFHNGIALAFKDAKKYVPKKEDPEVVEGAEYLKGGKYILINDKNETLVDSVDVTQLRNINWYSMQKNNPNIDTSIFITLKGTNGNNYSFMDYKKEFTKWFHGDFLPSLESNNNDKLKSLCFSEINFNNDKGEFISVDKNTFFKTYPNEITTKRFKEYTLKRVHIGQEELPSVNFTDYTKDCYKVFYNDCGQHFKPKYPLFEVHITFYKKREKEWVSDNPKDNEGISEFDRKYDIGTEENFYFIRTNDGYKLLTIPTIKIKNNYNIFWP